MLIVTRLVSEMAHPGGACMSHNRMLVDMPLESEGGGSPGSDTGGSRVRDPDMPSELQHYVEYIYTKCNGSLS